MGKDSALSLYNALKSQGKYTKSFAEFQGLLSDKQRRQKLYSALSNDGQYTKSFSDFSKQFSSDETALRTTPSAPQKKSDFVADTINMLRTPSSQYTRPLPSKAAGTFEMPSKYDIYHNLPDAIKRHQTPTPLKPEAVMPSVPSNAAESVWAAADKAESADVREKVDEGWSWRKIMQALSSGASVTGGLGDDNAQALETTSVAHLKTHDLQKLSDQAWAALGSKQQQSIINDTYRYLKEQYPDADDKALVDAARKMARAKSDEQMYNLAVEKNMPKSVGEFFLRKAAAASSFGSLSKGYASMMAGTSGDMEAEDTALQKYGSKHKVADIAGSVAGFAVDPLTYASGAVGGAATKVALWTGGKVLSEAAARKMSQTLGGKLLLGAVGGAANFGTFEAGGEALNQYKWGGTLDVDPETGRYVVGDFSVGKIASQMRHGLTMGGLTGAFGTWLGNVSTKAAQATSSTLGKLGVRAGELGVGLVGEGTIFATPEFISTYGDYNDVIKSVSDKNSPNYIADDKERSKYIAELKAQRGERMMDIWQDNLAMIAGFKAQHAIKSAGRTISELAASRRGKVGFVERMGRMLDGHPSLALSKEEQAELDKHGYGDLTQMVKEYKAYAQKDGDLPYNKITQLLNDKNVSEAARAKMYYYVTGHSLPMSAVIASNVIDNGDKTYTVQSLGDNGVITSRTYGNRKRADYEKARIDRQAELNGVAMAEQMFDNMDKAERLKAVCTRLAQDKGVSPETLLWLTRKDPKQMTAAEKRWIKEIEDAANEDAPQGENATVRHIKGVILDEYGVDVDKALRKAADSRTDAEKTAISAYNNELAQAVAERKNAISQGETTDAYRRGYEADTQGMRDAYVAQMYEPSEDNAETLRGVESQITESAKYQAALERDELKQMTHKDGSIHLATLKDKDKDGNGKQVYIVDGDVVMKEDGSGVDADASSKSVIIYDPASGEKKMVSPTAVDGIESLGEVKTAEQREAEINAHMQDTIQRSKDWLEGNVANPVGMQIQLGDGRFATIEAMHEDGKSAIATLPDGTQFLVPNDVLQRIVNNGQYADYKARRDAEASKREAEQSTESASETATEGGQPLPEEASPKEEERREYAQGDVFDVVVDGNKMHAEIVSPKDADGRFVVNVDDGESMRTLYVTPEELAAMEYREEPSPKAEETRLATEDSSDKALERGAQPTEEHTPTALERIPRDEKGNAQFHDVDTETAWDGLVEMSGNEETAHKVAEASLANAERKLKAAKALKEKGETPEELLQSIKENEAAAAEAQRAVDAWKAIVGEKSRREEAAKAEAERIAAEKAEAERKAAEERERAEAEEEARVEAERKAEEERKTKEEERKERDENGQPFVVSSDGTTTFGEITEDTGLTAAPIKLSEGVADKKGNGYGLRHIEARHGDQIRKAGFSSVEEFVKYVASNYDKHNIKIGKKRANGVETYLIQAEDEHSNMLYVELSKDGSYWNVNSGGIFRKGYAEKKKDVGQNTEHPTSATTLQDKSFVQTDKDNGSQSADTHSDKQHPSADKGTTLPADQQTSDEENTKKVADSEGENTLKAKIEAASADVNTEPTEAQKKAGNYKKGHVQVGTFDITIEQPEGSIRRGTDANGKQWEIKMHNTYGYFRGTEGVDGDHIDVFLSNDIDGWNGRKVFVVDQYNPDGTFDEHKVMLGFNDMDEAKSDYLANYEKGWENGRRITVSTTNLEDFEKWIDSSHRKTKPFSEYSSVNKGSEKAEKKQKKQSVFDKAKEIADKEEKKRKAEAEDDSVLGQATRAVGKKKKVNRFKYTASEKNSNLTLRGVHYANGYAYASDGYILFKEKADYPKEWEGTTRDKDGNLIDGKYPDTEKAIHRLVHIPDKEVESLPSKEVLDFAIAASKKLKGEAIPVAIDGIFFNAVNLKKFLEAVASKGMDKVVYRHPMLYATNGKDEIVMMPTVNTLEGALDIADRMESAGLPKEQIDAWKAHIEAADKKMSFEDFQNAEKNAKRKGVRLTEAESPKRKADERYQRGEGGVKPSKAEVALRDAVIDRLRESGMDVIADEAEGQRVLDEVNGRAKVQMGDAPETFAERQKQAVESHGVVMPGLNESYVEVVKDIPRHEYTGSIAEATREAIDAAKRKYAGKELTYNNYGANFNYTISANAIDICLSPKHQNLSANKGIHLALAEHLDEVINKSVEVEEHPDYIKGKDGKRGEEVNPNAIMHRFYGVAVIDGTPCRVMTLMREDGRSEEANGVHSYEVQKIEVLDNESPSTSNGVGTQMKDLSAYPLAKLLKGVEKSYDKGKYLLDESKKRSVGLREQRVDGADGVRFFRTANGEAYGFTVGGRIYIDPRIATSETPVHEYAHLWAEALRNGNPKEWQNVVELMKGTKVWDEVKARYPELKSDDEIADEVIATYSGRRGAERLREEQRKIAEGNGGVFEKAEAVNALERVKQALKKFWNGVADFLHIHYKSAEEVADRVMKDLLEGVDPRKMGKTKDGGVRFSAKQKRALETASLGNVPRSLTVVSSAAGANVLNNIENLAKEFEKSATQPKTFIGDVAKALGASRFGSGSEYATFETKNGNIVTIRLANHNAHVSGFDHNDKDNGISIVISPKPNEGITNDGNAHITEFYYDSIKLRRAEGKPLAEIVRSIKQALYSGEFKDTTGLAERQEVNGEDVIRYQSSSENSDKTLAGVHNITEEKLRKALKLGGLANPSVAVIDISKNSHEGFGEISLILPSEKVAKRTGKNAGTWQGDAWTPTYPQIERRMSNKGAEKASKDVLSVPSDMYSEVRIGLDRWLDSGEANSAMAYMFLHEKGVAPEPKKIQPKFSDEAYNELKSITAGNFNIYGISKADAQKVLAMYIDAYFDGDKDLYEDKTKAWLEKNRSIVDAGDKGGMRYAIAKENVKLYDEYGFNYRGVQTFVRDVEYDHRNTGVDMNATLNEVEDYIKTNSLTDEFNTWQEGKEKEYGIKEVIFDGFTPSGNRRYIPNTLENVSKIMKKQGRNGATGAWASFPNFAARLMPSYGTLEDIRSKKGLLTSDREKIDDFREKWSKVFFELGMKCQPDATGTFDDYGFDRLSEAAMTSDPQAFLKQEYNVDFSDEDTKRLKKMVKAIKEEYPAMYFETKFERPVYLNEFAAVVVPNDLGADVKKALSDLGIAMYEYDASKEGDRSRAFDEAVKSSGKIRFQFIGEKGAAEADHAEEVLPTLTTGGGDIIIMPDGRVLKASPRVLARVTGLPDTYKMPETDQLSHTIVGNGIPTQLTEGVIAPLLDNAIPSAERATKRESVFDVADRVSQNLEERTRAMAVKKANDRFNEELEMQVKGELEEGHVYKLGMPSEILLSTGVPNLPIQMSAQRLEDKATKFGHNFDIAEVKDLVNAIQKPIAIFEYGDRNKSQNLIVEIQKDGKNFIIGLSLNPVVKGKALEINSVRNVFPKDNAEWLNWISQNKLLYADKEKIQVLIDKQQTNLADVNYLNLDDVAKKVKDFENPKLFDGKISEVDKKGSDSIDRSVRENPKNEDKPRYSRKPGESIFDYASRVSEDVDRSVRERVSARDEYEKKVKSKGFQTKEALQNSMLGLQEFMSAIDHASGNKRYIEDIPDFENPILGENRLSSVNKEEMHQVAKTQFKPLMSAVAKLSGNGKESGELYDYMFAKHGLERDAVMRQREAQKEFDKYQKANPKGTKTIGDFVASLEGKDYAGLTALTAEDGRVKSIQSQIDAIDEQMKATDDQLLLRKLGGQKKRLKVDLLNAARDAADDIRKAFESNPSHDRSDINELWKRVNEVNGNTLRKLYESGLLTKEAYDDISSMYTNYIPMRGFDQTTSADAYAYLTHGDSAFNAPIKTAKGRSSKADNPIAYMQAMAESAIMQGNRNVLVKQKMLNFVRNHPSDLASVSDVWLQYDSVADEWKPVFPDNIGANDSASVVAKKMEAFEDKMKQMAENHPDLVKRSNEAPDIPYKVVEKGQLNEHQVLVRQNGKSYIITVNGSPRAAQAANGLTNPDTDLTGAVGKVFEGAEALNRQLSSLYTTLNPDFIGSNYVRDALYSNTMVYVKEGAKYGGSFNLNFAKYNPAEMANLYARYNKGSLDTSNETHRLFLEFMQNGGETGFVNLKQIEKRKSEIAKAIKREGKISAAQIWGGASDAIDFANRAVENSARFAAYVTSRRSGRSVGRSVYDAKEISVNFNRKGSGSKFMGAEGQTKAGNAAAFVSGAGRGLYIFWNAGLQGLTNFSRQIGRHPGRALTLASLLFGFGALMSYLGSNDDDDENNYFNLPKYIRRSNVCFKLGDLFVTIPLPVEYRAFYGLGELASSTLAGKEDGTTKDIAKEAVSQVSQLFPIDFAEGGGGLHALIPSAVKPIVEAETNTAWTGLPIYKDNDFNKNMPEYTKVYKTANGHLVEIARALNDATGGNKYKKGFIDINPAKMEYVLKGMLGGAFSFPDKLVKTTETIMGDREFDWRNTPFANRFVKNADERTEYKALNEQYFKLKDEMDVVKQQLKGFEKEADAGNEKYEKALRQLEDSKDYERLELFKDYEKEFKGLNDELKELRMSPDYDKAEEKELQKEIAELQRQLIDEMREIKK